MVDSISEYALQDVPQHGVFPNFLIMPPRQFDAFVRDLVIVAACAGAFVGVVAFAIVNNIVQAAMAVAR